MGKKYLFDLLTRSNKWEVGDSEDFVFRTWRLQLRKEEPEYAPFTLAV
ncbi:hypothetical protein [Paenibacillus sp. FSL L8-0709]